MVLPNLIHPIPVEIETLSRAETFVDDDYREPIQDAARGARTVVRGQIKWGADDQVAPSAVGAESSSDGYVLFRTVDLRAAGIPIVKQGDRFVRIGAGANAIPVDVYVVKVVPMGHYPDQGGATLVKAYFKDRMPAKYNRGGEA